MGVMFRLILKTKLREFAFVRVHITISFEFGIGSRDGVGQNAPLDEE